MWLASAALAGATLSKGLIGIVLPGGALVVYTALTRDFAVWRRLHLDIVPRALSRAHRAVVRRGLARERRVLRVLFRARALPALPSWRGRAPRPLVLLRAVSSRGLPALAVDRRLRRPARVARRRRRTRSASRGSGSRSSWAAFVFVFFSASGSKLPSYILPMFPPLALVVGWLLLRIETRTLVRLSWPLLAAGIVLGIDASSPRGITS